MPRQGDMPSTHGVVEPKAEGVSIDVQRRSLANIRSATSWSGRDGCSCRSRAEPSAVPPYFAFGGASLLVVDAWAAGGAWVMGLLAAGGIAYVIGGLTVQHQSAE